MLAGRAHAARRRANRPLSIVPSGWRLTSLRRSLLARRKRQVSGTRRVSGTQLRESRCSAEEGWRALPEARRTRGANRHARRGEHGERIKRACEGTQPPAAWSRARRSAATLACCAATRAMSSSRWERAREASPPGKSAGRPAAYSSCTSGTAPAGPASRSRRASVVPRDEAPKRACEPSTRARIAAAARALGRDRGEHGPCRGGDPPRRP